MTEWVGNVEVRLYEKKDTFALKSADVRRYATEGVSLVFSTGDANCWVQIRFTTDDCLELIRMLAKSLQESSLA